MCTLQYIIFEFLNDCIIPHFCALHLSHNIIFPIVPFIPAFDLSLYAISLNFSKKSPNASLSFPDKNPKATNCIRPLGSLHAILSIGYSNVLTPTVSSTINISQKFALIICLLITTAPTNIFLLLTISYINNVLFFNSAIIVLTSFKLQLIRVLIWLKFLIGYSAKSG